MPKENKAKQRVQKLQSAVLFVKHWEILTSERKAFAADFV